MIRLADRIKRTAHNRKGVTLVELIVVVVLVSLVLACIYLFFGFAVRSWNQTRATSGMLQDSNLFLIRMEKEFRQAQNPAGPAVELFGGGSQVVIYTYDDKAPQLVSYRVTDGRMERALNGDFNSDPSTWVWTTVLAGVSQGVDGSGSPIPYFRITDTKKIIMYLLVTDPEGHVDMPIEVTDTFTVRSKGAM